MKWAPWVNENSVAVLMGENHSRRTAELQVRCFDTALEADQYISELSQPYMGLPGIVREGNLVEGAGYFPGMSVCFRGSIAEFEKFLNSLH